MKTGTFLKKKSIFFEILNKHSKFSNHIWKEKKLKKRKGGKQKKHTKKSKIKKRKRINKEARKPRKT